MSKFNAGQSFSNGDTVTGPTLNNITGLLDIYTGLISEQTAMVATVSTADQLLIADTDNGDSGAANRVTVQKLFSDSLTNGTFTGLNLSGSLSCGTSTSNRTVATSATITTGTIATLNSTTGTIGNLSTTLAGDFTITQGTGTIGTSAVTTAKINDAAVTNAKLANPQYTGFRNRIINGDMVIDQRNAGASVTVTGTNFSVDRFFGYASVTSKFTVQQNAGAITPPAGFANYLGATSSGVTSLGAGDFYALVHRIEGYNIADLAWGTASASSVTLSFRVYSSLTGTFGGTLTNGGATRSYPFTYSIPTANTWTTISVTVAGDTTGTWNTTTSGGISLNLGLGVGTTYSGTAGAWSAGNYLSATGAVSVVGTNGATFYITGIQLEAGSTATDFERRPIGTELALCQRYFNKSYDLTVQAGTASTNGYIAMTCSGTTTQLFGSISFPVRMRSSATLVMYSFSGTASKWSDAAGSNQTGTGSIVATENSVYAGSNTSALALGTVYLCHYTASAEL